MAVGDRDWNVLVVDDEVDLLTLVRRTLEFEDRCSIVTASTAAEAMERAAETPPDLVVLDHVLGGPVTGLQLADRLRRAHPQARVILFSAVTDVIDLRDHPVDAVVAKMDVGDLASVVRRVLADSATS